MPQRNGPRSQRGRSAVARTIMRSAGSNNGALPQKNVFDQNGQLIRNAMFFGDTDIVKPPRVFLGKLNEAGSLGHGGRDRHQARVFGRKFADGLAEHRRV